MQSPASLPSSIRQPWKWPRGRLYPFCWPPSPLQHLRASRLALEETRQTVYCGSTQHRSRTLCRSAPPALSSPAEGGCEIPTTWTKWLTFWLGTLRNRHSCIWNEMHYSNGHTLPLHKVVFWGFKQASTCVYMSCFKCTRGGVQSWKSEFY